MSYLYLDIETVGTTDPAIVAEIAAGITPPKSMSKADTIAAWEKDSKPALVAEAIAKTSFSGAYGHVCCIGWAWGAMSPQAVIWKDESATIHHAFDAIEAGVTGYVNPIIVGHYVANFDLRFLMQRAMVLGVRLPGWWPFDPKPWGRDVLDTMHAWCGAKDSISLDNLCKALGIPGKGDVTGADVAGMWARGEYDAIADYCRADVERVRSVHRKMQIAFGEGVAA